MGQKAGRFYGIKKTERNRKYLSDWLGPHSQPCSEWEGPELAWCLGLGDWRDCVSG